MRKFISSLLIGSAVVPVFGQAAAVTPDKGLNILPADINIILVAIAALMLVPIWSMSNTFLLARGNTTKRSPGPARFGSYSPSCWCWPVRRPWPRGRPPRPGASTAKA